MAVLGWLIVSLHVFVGLCSCADSPSCNAAGYDGVCMDTSCCSGGTSTSGLCPGASTVQCCTLPTCSTPSGDGYCMTNSVCTGTWHGTPVSGYCNGDSTMQCCVPATCSSSPGMCIDQSACGGTTLTGQCNGPTAIKCCVGAATPTAVPPTSPPTLPPPTPASGSFTGVDLALTASSTVWSCLRNAGYSYGIVRAWRSSGTADSSACGNIQRAHAAGFTSVDVYMFPCPKCSASAATQVANLISALSAAGCTSTTGAQGSKNFGKVWLDVEQGSTYWSSSVSANVAWFNGMKSACTAAGVKCGVYTSKSQWVPIMGSSTAGSNLPLWYAHYDAVTAFSDFSAFGGWSSAYMKQFNGDKTVCSYGIDMNWTPNSQPQTYFGDSGTPPGLEGTPQTTDQESSATLLLPGALVMLLSFL